MAHAVQHLPAPTAGVPCAAPGVVVIGTGTGFHLLLQDHPSDTTLNLRHTQRERKRKTETKEIMSEHPVIVRDQMLIGCISKNG